MKNLGYYGRRNVCGERVRMARLAKRISQETLAAKMQTKGVNIAQDAISNIESGARDVYKRQIPDGVKPSRESGSEGVSMGTRKNYQRKANGNESPLHVLPVASKLIDYTLDLTDNTKHFPKKVRFTIVNKMCIRDRPFTI